MGAAPNIPDSNGVSFLAALNAAFAAAWSAFQTQDATAWTSAGTAPAFTLAPTPALASYVAGQRFRIKFSANATAPTLNVSALGAKNVKVLNTLGVKIAAVIFANMLVDCEYDGTDWVILTPVQPKNAGPLRNYRASCTGASAAIAMAADLITLRDAGGSYIELAAVSETLTISGSGAGGLDTGTLAASTWYHKFIIYNPATGDVSSLCSLSATAPTLPSGYTHWMRTGAFRTDASANKYPLGMTWVDSAAAYKVGAGSNLAALPLMITGDSGSSSTPTWTAVSVSNFIPATAASIDAMGFTGTSMGGTNRRMIVAPNNSYGGAASLTNPPPFMIASDGTAWGLSHRSQRFVLESTNLYYASNLGGSQGVACAGWVDSI